MRDFTGNAAESKTAVPMITVNVRRSKPWIEKIQFF
jgi:hypothetical protein